MALPRDHRAALESADVDSRGAEAKNFGPTAQDKARVLTFCCKALRQGSTTRVLNGRRGPVILKSKVKLAHTVSDRVGRCHLFCTSCWPRFVVALKRAGRWPADERPFWARGPTGHELEGYGSKPMSKTEVGLLPEVDEGDVNADFPPFLGIDDLRAILGKAKNVTAVITGMPRPSQYGFTVDLKIKGHPVRSLTLRTDADGASLNLKRCIVAFGRAPAGWVGQKVTLGIGVVKTGKYAGNGFLQVEPIGGAAPKAKVTKGRKAKK